MKSVEARFEPGFRLSTSDAVVIVAGAFAAAAVALFWPWLGFAIAWVVGHFFLFCNVFRIARLPELLWAALFIALAAGTVLFGWPGWVASALLALGGAAALVLVEMRKPSYHGVGWKRINPSLRTWWEAHAGQRA